METAQSMQDELQQSVLLQEEDAEFEEDDMIDTKMINNGDPATANNASHVHDNNAAVVRNGDYSIENNSADIDVTVEDNWPTKEVDDPGPEGEIAEDDDASQDDEGSGSEAVDEIHDEGVYDEDAEGEEDGEVDPRVEQNDISNGESDDEAEDEAEGVGAVKIKPGETDEDDGDSESESDGDASVVSGASDEGEYEDAAEPDAEDEDEEDEVVDSNICIFCKQDEENDPSEEFEPYLGCKGCGEHAHQQCARDAHALNDKMAGAGWRCPECGRDEESESEAESTAGDAQVNADAEDGEISPASTRRSTASKLARDLLPSARNVKQDSHSVFNQLVLDEDPMDGSRVLRKRKTSSAEADEDVMSLRKRHKNTPDDSVQGEANQEKANGAGEAGAPVRSRSARSFRLKISNPAARCTVMKKSRTSLLLKMRVGPAELQQILSRKPKPKKRSSRAVAASRSARSTAAARSNTAAAAEASIPMAPFLPSSSYTQPFYSFYDKETDDLKGKPYGGILTEAESDTSKTLPTKDDRKRFDEAKQRADEEWRNRLIAMQAEMEVPVKKSKKASGPASQIECIEFGGWEIDTWYAAPYPEEYSRNRVLYICEFCLKYMNSDYVAWRHKLKCPAKHPPGDEIYRHGSISFFEVDGRKNPVYCQNLCLLAKLFLGSKTLYYDVEPFLFYVLCEYDDLGYHFVGYFSKEKRASSQNNVSCILTLPIHQRKGYGNLLIDFSYLLTRVEEKTGSPEKPLSDMGLVSYRNYWRLVLCKYFIEHTPEDKSQKGLSIRQISEDTGMMPDDVISALEGLRCLVRDPQTQVYAFRVDLPFCREHVAKWEAKKYVKLNDKALTWTPYVMGRSNATNFELGPALNAIAPREEDDEPKPVPALVESGIATGDFAVANGTSQKPMVEAESNTVLESTEPNDNAMEVSQETSKTNGISKENGETKVMEAQPEEPTKASTAAKIEGASDWKTQYKDIPASRFEVFPPINHKRPAAPRLSASIARPTTVRAPATVPRPRPKRSAGNSARKSSSRPKASSTARRKSGGTGRGPGRWPKGTKKADYGNADSGPGLPPGWLEREKARKAALGKAEDTVEVKQGKEKTTTAATFAVKDDAVPDGDSSSSDENDNGKAYNDAEAAVDGAVEDEDAEGEDDDA